MEDNRKPPADFDRRALLKAMAASLALAAAAGRQVRADERALPYVNAPEFVIPGKAKWYATAVCFAGYAQPILGKTQVGRPVKLEGNPEHPACRGATDAFTQAALLDLYDPRRSQTPRRAGQPVPWAAFDTAIDTRRRLIDDRQGEGFRLLTGRVTSPTLQRQIAALMARWPKARWHVHEPFDDDRVFQATQRAFGRALQPHLRLDRAEAVVCLDDDLLGPGPRQTLHGRLWSARRLAFQARQGDSRLYIAEPTPSLTGARADDRLVVSSHRLAALAKAIAQGLGLATSAPDLAARERQWVDSAVTALKARPGRALLTVGPQHPEELQVLCLAINDRLGAIGTTLAFTDPVAAQVPQQGGSLPDLVADMMAGAVSTLLVLDSNPVYTAPRDLDLHAALQRVEFKVHAGHYNDETAALSDWHAPLQHDLESWSDGRAVDGTTGLIQPLVRPFFSVRSAHVLLERWLGREASDRDIVRGTWRQRWGDDFDSHWSDALVQGFVPGSAPPEVTPRFRATDLRLDEVPVPSGLSAELRPDACVWDGRLAANAWLQETPKPFTKVTWGNMILLGQRLAAARGINAGDELHLDVDGASIVGAAWPMPGQDEATMTLSLGYGRTTDGLQGQGYDAFAFCRTTERWQRTGVTLTPTGKKQAVACTQPSQAMDGFDFVRTVGSPNDATPPPPPAASFYPDRKYESPSWGMSIDLDLCIGCNACMVACRAENNVPVVGKELVADGRVMHWLRVDHYHSGDPAAPQLHFQPVPCMHCEEAPCEMGCPVNATVHSHDGLNVQVYNRCIGTRTCSAYCPYKVRRFNWFDFTGEDPESIQAMRNPDVTVRSRGVMEKCTYCVQRISAARIAAKIAGRAISDGEVVTACQQVCPAEAISFGDVTRADTAVSRRKASPRNYSLLEEANTRPRTTYLARIRKDGGT